MTEVSDRERLQQALMRAIDRLPEKLAFLVLRETWHALLDVYETHEVHQGEAMHQCIQTLGIQCIPVHLLEDRDDDDGLDDDEGEPNA
jgi:hypothetical protein